MHDLQRQKQKKLDLGRAKNALQNYLIRKLLIPKVYLDVEWGGSPVDVLAIDRAGVGDVHAVRIAYYRGKFTETFVETVIDHVASPGNDHDSVTVLRSLPSHFLYIAVVFGKSGSHEFSLPDLNDSKLLAEDGVGRIGILYVDLSGDEPSVEVKLKAERFRSSKEIVELADRFVLEHTANWEFRDEPAPIL
jgi:hypothetical protein